MNGGVVESMPAAACAEARLACVMERRRMEAAAAEERANDRVKLESILEKVSALVDLLPRLAALELWRAGINGAAAEAAKVEQRAHHRDGEPLEHEHHRSSDEIAAAVVIALKASGALGHELDILDYIRRNWKVVAIVTLVFVVLVSMAADAINALLGPVVKDAAGRLMK